MHQLNITQGNDFMLRIALTKGWSKFPIQDAENVSVSLISPYRKATFTPTIADDILVVNIDSDRLPAALYGIEVSGILKGSKWRTCVKNIIRITHANERDPHTTVPTSGDAYDIHMDVVLFAAAETQDLIEELSTLRDELKEAQSANAAKSDMAEQALQAEADARQKYESLLEEVSDLRARTLQAIDTEKQALQDKETAEQAQSEIQAINDKYLQTLKVSLIGATDSEPNDTLVIPEGINKIRQYAFYNASHLKSITIPEGLTEIGSNAFAKCDNLISASLPESLIKMDRYAFGECI